MSQREDKLVRDILAVDTSQDQWDCRKQQIKLVEAYAQDKNKQLRETINIMDRSRKLQILIMNKLEKENLELVKLIENKSECIKTELPNGEDEMIEFRAFADGDWWGITVSSDGSKNKIELLKSNK